MDNGKAILLDVLHFLPQVEARLLGKSSDISDMLEITSLRQSLEMLEKMVTKCDSAVSAEEMSGIRKRISVARETVDVLAIRSPPVNRQSQFRDTLSLPENATASDHCDVEYARCLNMSNEEFDALIEEWAEDRAHPGASVKGKRKSRGTPDTTQDKIRSDLVKLADTMKSKALWYRDQLVKDNEALSKYTVEQEKQLDTVASVATEASKLTKTARLTLRQSLFMIASLFVLVVFMLMIFIVT